MIKNFLLYLFSILLFTHTILLPHDKIEFELLNPEHGLSQRIVYSIIQDRYGFLWFGTRNGLNRYDGYRFLVYKHNRNDPNSLSNNVIRSICKDKSGNLWIGTWGGGLNKFDPGKERFTRFIHNPEDNTGLKDNFISKVFPDSTGMLWIITRKGLNRFDTEKNTFTGSGYDPSTLYDFRDIKIASILEDSIGNIWIGTGNGLYKFNKKMKGFKHYIFDTVNINENYDNFVRTIFEDNSGRLWTGTSDGEIYIYAGKEDRFKSWSIRGLNVSRKLSLDGVGCFKQDQFDNIWMGTCSRGLVRYNLKDQRVTHYKYNPFDLSGLCDNRIKSIYLDRSGSLWIGSDSGINKFSPYKKKFNHYKHDPRKSNCLNNNRVRSIFEDSKGQLWIGTLKGLIRFDRKKNKIFRYKPEISSQNKKENCIVNITLEDCFKDLWFGTNSGLLKLGRKNRQFTLYQHDPGNPDSLIDNMIWSIHEYKKNILLIGTKGGLDKFNVKTGKFTHYVHNPEDPDSLCNNFVHNIFEDRYGLLWVGTDEGMDQFDIGSGKFKHYKHEQKDPDSLSHNNVWAIHEDKYGILWVGTLEGLNKFNRKEDNFNLIGNEPGFSGKAIYGILEDENGTLWISTDNGLYRFNTQTNSLRNYNIHDGLQGKEFGLFCYFRSNSGEMFFGGSNGFNSFFPRQVADNPYIPPVVITGLKIFNRPVEVNDQSILKKSITATRSIEASHEKNFISFEFAALDFTIPSQNQYAFFLEGFDREWHFAGSKNHATYTNLPPGKYTFRVKGSNNDKVWNEEGAALKLTILPPFWLAWWFKTIIFISLICFFVTLYILRVKSIKEKILQKERIDQLIMSQKMKLVGLLAAGATHDLSNLLFTIVSYSKKIAVSSPDTPEARKIDKVKNAASKAVQIVKQILAFSRPNNIRPVSQDISLLTDEILNILRIIIPENIHLRWKREKCGCIIVVDQIKFQQIIINLVFNAVEAMPDGGELKIFVLKENNKACINIEDTGNGMEEKVIQKIFTPHFTTKPGKDGSGLGLFVVNQIVSEYNGQIEVISSVGKGTIFKIYFPLKRFEKK